jgi:hypothetical protein
MAQDNEDFLRRWARRKREAAAAAPAASGADASPAPRLPGLDSLDFESDFKAFMHSKVEETVKRAALKKLFSDPRFNVMDGLDVYIGDYSKEDPISDAMLASLEHARQTLFGPKKEEPASEEQAKTETAKAEAPQNDVDPAQDPEAV